MPSEMKAPIQAYRLLKRFAIIVFVVACCVGAWFAGSALAHRGSANDEGADGLAKAPAGDAGYRLINYDLGVVAPDSKTERVVTITNDSSKTRTVKSISNDCGCVVQELSSRVAAPGGKWQLKFRYRAPATPGAVSRQIMLRFSENDVEPVLVQIRGRVGYWAQPSPDEVSFGSVLPGGQAVKTLQVITPTPNEQFAGEPVVSGVPWVSVRLLGSDKVVGAQNHANGTRHRFRLTFCPPANAKAAIHDGEIRFAKAVGPGLLRVPCRATVLSPIEVSPSDVFFGLVAPGRTKTCKVCIRLHDPEVGFRASDLSLTSECGPEFRTYLSDGKNSNEVILTVEVIRSANGVVANSESNSYGHWRSRARFPQCPPSVRGLTMIPGARFGLFLAVILLTGSHACAQEPDSKADFKFVLAGMRHERSKIRSAVCRITGRFIARDPAQSEPTFDGPIDILSAFEGETKVRFDTSMPGWVPDPSSELRADPNNPGRVLGQKRMKGTYKTHFFDNGKKASFWIEHTAPSISVYPSWGKRRPRVGFFDTRALGLYFEVAREREDDMKTLLDAYTNMPAIPKVDRSDPAVWLVSWTGPSSIPDAETRIWIDVRNGFTPVRFQILQRAPKNPNAPWSVTENSETQWERRGEVWIPIKHSQAKSPLGANGVWIAEREYEIRWESINQPVDDSLFDYPSFGAPDYIGVYDNTLGQPIVVKPIGKLPDVYTGKSAQRRRTNYYLYVIGVGAFGLVLAAGFLAWRRHSRRRGKPSSANTRNALQMRQDLT